MTSFLPTLNYSLTFGTIGLGLGWYLRGRGLAGVEIDLANIKNDIIAVKNHLFGTPSAPTTVAA